MVQVNWTRQAVADLKSIYDYISKDSVQYAKLQVIRIKNKTNILKTHAYSGKIIPEFYHEQYRELEEGNYRIIYKIVNKTTIDILTIHHAKRDLTRRKLS